ncbi:MAG: UDP-N-acetylglucosamine 2-epimerase (non-hydrolyzing) [Spirochaetes bacterium]|nr:UDP-N-acetylglucosamine 2-epimerase (non-hydrolyzing) [Spirochaetota bacterium]
MKKILFIFGTRPEAIKMSPLIKEFYEHKDKFEIKVCITAQHRQMLDQILDFFKIKPDFDLNLMKTDQTLFDITSDGLLGVNKIISNYKPDLVFVQGDTTTVLVSTLASYYHKISVAHLEAGLRSNNKYSPFPEEINRTLTGHIADFHFAPTLKAKKNLNRENIFKNIWVVGNTVIDALFLGLDIIKSTKENDYLDFFNFTDFSKKIILVTGHRRESFGKPFENICNALKFIAEKNSDVEIIYPVHLNPNVQKTVKTILKSIKNIHLIEPLDYPYLIYLMNRSYIVLTDSGGIQEEAPSLGKPVLVMRDVTERMEGVKAGNAKLVGTNYDKIIKETTLLLRNKKIYNKMSKAKNPYGDGMTSKKIVEILSEVL